MECIWRWRIRKEKTTVAKDFEPLYHTPTDEQGNPVENKMLSEFEDAVVGGGVSDVGGGSGVVQLVLGGLLSIVVDDDEFRPVNSFILSLASHTSTLGSKLHLTQLK